jgi:hypothetical protein
MIQENFTGKGDVQHKLKGWKPYIEKSKLKDRRNPNGITTSKSKGRSTSITTHGRTTTTGARAMHLGHR